MSRRVYLHIGTEKTGTSSIQHFFAKKRDELKKLGILYPLSLGTPSNMKIAAAAENYFKMDDLRVIYELKNKNDIDKFRKTIVQNLQKEIEESVPETIIISSEHLSSRLDRVEEIEMVKEILSPFVDEFKIVIYIRNQYRFFESRYSTAIKTGNVKDFKIPKNGEACIDFHYWELLQRWEKVYGKENMIVRRFERDRLIDGDIVKDFVSAVNIDIDIKDEDLENQNISLGAKKLEFLKYLNEYLPLIKDNKVNIFRGGIVTFLENIEMEDIPLRLSRKNRENLMSRFEEENRKVAEYYFGEKRLFSIERVKGREKKPPKLSVKETFMLFAKLWEMQQQRILSMEDKQKELYGKIRDLRFENAVLKDNLKEIGRYAPASFSGGAVNEGVEKRSVILKEGFYHREKWGIWTNGEKISEFLVKIDEKLIKSESALIMQIEYRYLKDSYTKSFISIDDGEYMPLSEEGVVIPPDIPNRNNGMIRFKLRHENPSSPAALGLNPKDRRVMGCGIKSITFRQAEQ